MKHIHKLKIDRQKTKLTTQWKADLKRPETKDY